MTDPGWSGNNRWLLPEGIDEVLPEQARHIEALRRALLDLYDRWGYDLVIPPFIEYLDSLVVGMGRDLDLKTFKLIDQLTGRLMGVRADMTLQVARIDTHRLRREEPVRLCYLGTVLHARPDGLAGSRSPLQVGLELYGHAGVESDLEVVSLMLATLEMAGVRDPHLDLGHVGIYRTLAADAGLDAQGEATLFELLQRKAVPEIEAWLAGQGVDDAHRDRLQALATLHGGVEVLDRARELLAGAGTGVAEALDRLAQLAARLQSVEPAVPLHFDLAELRGYRYQTGVVFAAFTPAHGTEVARGGRYDEIGRVFGRARPATGFSADLKTLIRIADSDTGVIRGIFAPPADDPALRERVRELRRAGERVVSGLPGQAGDAASMGCDRELRLGDNGWEVVRLPSGTPSA